MRDEGADIPLPEEIDDEWLWAWRAWWRLHFDRAFHGGGMGAPVPCRITWRAVVEWCDFHGYPGATVELLDGLFGVLDNIYFEHYAKQVRAATA